MQINAYVILDNLNIPNWWSISHSAAQSWADFQDWFQQKDPEVFVSAPDVGELVAAGYKCVEITFDGVVV